MKAGRFFGAVWQHSRRSALWTLVAAPLFAVQVDQQQPGEGNGLKLPDNNEEPRLPDGRSQKNAMAKEQHAQALKDADQLVTLSEELRAELHKAGDFVVPVSAVRKTSDIEKLARRIRGRLRY